MKISFSAKLKAKTIHLYYICETNIPLDLTEDFKNRKLYFSLLITYVNIFTGIYNTISGPACQQ